MLLRLVLASVRRRFRQLGLILAAVTVAAATVVTSAGFSSRAGHQLEAGFSAFGPNLTVRPQVGGPALLPPSALARVRMIAGVAFARGDGQERIEVRADSARLAEVARGIEAEVEGVEAVPLRRVSESDARLTRRLTLLLVAVSAVSFLLALLSVGAATTALVGERRSEIGLFLALGFTGRRIGLFLAAELLAAAVVAGMLGEILGELAAGSLVQRILGAGGGPSLTWSGLAAAAVVAMLVVGSSMLLALRRVERLDAARVLRGD
jgi:ABC-type lipoprotein release transport system permease subunit